MTTSAIPQPLSRALGAVLALALLMAAMVLTAAPADAHARLEGSSPQDGATLTAVPPEVVLRFNEPIKEGLNQVSVTSGSTDVAKGEPQADGSNVYQPVEYTMDPGTYTVTYKVVSADGHPVSGSFDFTYAPPEAEGSVQDPEATPFSPSESSPAEESSESASEEPSATATSEPSESESEEASESPSATSSSSDSPTSESTTQTPQDEQDAADTQEGTSPWWWALAAGALVLVIGGLVLLVRGRRDADDEDGF